MLSHQSNPKNIAMSGHTWHKILPCSQALKIGKFHSVILSMSSSSSLECGSSNSSMGERSPSDSILLSLLLFSISSDKLLCWWHLQEHGSSLSLSLSFSSFLAFSIASFTACASSLLTRRKAFVLSGDLRNKLGEDVPRSDGRRFNNDNEGDTSGDDFLWMFGEPCSCEGTLFVKYVGLCFGVFSWVIGLMEFADFTITVGLSPGLGELLELEHPWISGLVLRGDDESGIFTALELCSSVCGLRVTDMSGSTVGIPVADVVVVQVLDMRRLGEFNVRRMRLKKRTKGN